MLRGALLRRRMHLMRKRADLLSHVPNTHSPYNLPAIGKTIASKAPRAGVAARFPAPAVPKTIEVDLALIPYEDERLRALELAITKTAKHHDAPTLSLVQTVPGLGQLLRRVLLYAVHQLARFPRVPDCASYARLVTWSKDSGGKRLGTSGTKIAHAHLKAAFSEAAALFLRPNEPGHKYLARWEKKHDTGKALSILAPQLARAVSSLLQRQMAFAMALFLRTSGSSAGEPDASLATQGMSL